MATVEDRTTAYEGAQRAIDRADAKGENFDALERALIEHGEGLRSDEREALWLYAWGLIARRRQP